MKKNGFTLTEVLITLGIIGVIVALTIPALSQNVSQKSVGPALSKAIANLESVNRKALAEKNALRLYDVDEDYSEIIKQQMNAICSDAEDDNFTCTSNDGIAYLGPKGSFTSGDGKSNSFNITIDINGKKGKNKIDIDQFTADIYASGEVKPTGVAEKIKENGWEFNG